MAGMTRQQLADKFGLTRRTIRGWASGTVPFYVQEWAKERCLANKWRALSV